MVAIITSVINLTVVGATQGIAKFLIFNFLFQTKSQDDFNVKCTRSTVC